LLRHAELTWHRGTGTTLKLNMNLSAREFFLLAELVERPGAILSRAQLEQRLYGWGEEVESNAVEVHIHHLRKKLGSDFIRNVRGLGYTLSKPA
jgi:DNA-binding response OmpR family regulator